MNNKLGGKIMKEFVTQSPKTYNYLTDDNEENKEAKKTKKKCVIKRKLKFEDYKHCLEAIQVENKTNQQEQSKTDVDGPRENHKEFKENNDLIVKPQQRFRSEKHNVLTEEVNRIAFNANDNKRIQSIDSIETYAYGTSKELVCKNKKLNTNSKNNNTKND